MMEIKQDETLEEFYASWQPGISKYYWLNWQQAESHRLKQKYTF